MTREQAIELLQERVKVCESYKGIACIEEYKEALLIAIEDMREADHIGKTVEKESIP